MSYIDKYRKDPNATKGSLLKIGDASKLLHVSNQTLRDWSDSGKVPVTVSESGHRSYYEADIVRLELENKGITGYWTSGILVAMDVHGKIHYANSETYDLANKNVETFFTPFDKYWNFTNGLATVVHQIVLNEGEPFSRTLGSSDAFPFNGSPENKDPMLAVPALSYSVKKEDAEKSLHQVVKQVEAFIKTNYIPQVTYVWFDKIIGEIKPY